MATYTNAAAAGSGQAALGMTHVTYMAFKFTAIGAGVSHPTLADLDQVLRAGWVSVGVHLDPFGDGSQIYWNDLIWLDFNLLHWPAIPTRVSGSASDMSGDTIRWHFGPGTTCKLFVFGS